uniref:Uncharacterized protein n=1 Tax=Moumouvirus sp. 'Monve' TaxID=1128131 RepID=H2ECX6_9VIRU|nr:hypothetical protein mv_R44 [Moumouvirus Monve]
MQSVFGFLNYDNDTIGYKKMLCYMRNNKYKTAIATLIIPPTAKIISRENNNGYREGEMVTDIAFVQKMETLDGEIFDDSLASYCSDNGSALYFETGKTTREELIPSIHQGVRFFPNKKKMLLIIIIFNAL